MGSRSSCLHWRSASFGRAREDSVSRSKRREHFLFGIAFAREKCRNFS